MPSPEFENLVQMFKAQRTDARPEIGELRTAFDMLGSMMPVADGVTTEVTKLGGMTAERHSPEGAPDDRIILYLHGGGYCIGTCDSHRPVTTAIAKASGIAVIVPEYRLAPEHPFPAAVEDARAAYEDLLAEGYDAKKIVVSGESAGGGLTFALLLSLHDDGRPLPACAAPLSPWVDMSGLGDVSDAALELDFLRPEAIALFAASYVPDGVVAPLNSPVSADLSGLPPMLIQGGEREILIDMIRRVAAQAKDCGVDVTLEVDPGMFHAWHLFSVLPEAQDAIARVARFANEHLA
ncbi:MAG: alpha/beta hydrolase [Actinomycetota bacterium]